MTASDIEAVTSVAAKCFANPWSRDSFEYAVENDNYYGLVAINKDNVIGFCIMTISFDDADIVDVAVAPEFRRKGIASRLIAELISEGEKREVIHYTLEVRAGNIAAKTLYAKFGFNQISTRKDYYTSPTEDAIIMALDDIS